jgi:hypothetical protein
MRANPTTVIEADPPATRVRVKGAVAPKVEYPVSVIKVPDVDVAIVTGTENGMAPLARFELESTYSGLLAVATAFAEVLTGFPATKAFSVISTRTESGVEDIIYFFVFTLRPLWIDAFTLLLALAGSPLIFDV